MIALMLTLLLTPMAQLSEVDDDLSAEVLVERIKASLIEVDEALEDAAAADAVTDEVDRAMSAHRRTIRDIDELIKQFKYQAGGGGGGGGKPQQQQQQQQQQSNSQQRESDGSQQDPSQQDDPTAQKQREDGGEDQPDGHANDQPGEQRSADQPPPPGEQARFERQDTDDRWGLLPPKLQERLLNLHLDDIPERYRTHLEAYIKAMHRVESPDSR